MRTWTSAVVSLGLILGLLACGGSSSTPASPTTPTATTYTLAGTVTNATTAAPIAGATVAVADGTNAGKVATTNAAGSFALPGLQASGFTVTITASGYVTAARGVTLTSNQTLQVPLSPAAVALTGTVSDQGGGRIATATILVLDGPNAGRTASTTATGEYRFDNLTPGAANLSATAPGFNEVRRTATIGGTLNWTLQTTQPWSRSGSGDNVFTMPSYVSRVRIVGTYTHNSSNFVVYIGGRLMVNELLGYGWGATTYDGTLLTTGGIVEVKLSSGVDWSFTEVR